MVSQRNLQYLVRRLGKASPDDREYVTRKLEYYQNLVGRLDPDRTMHTRVGLANLSQALRRAKAVGEDTRLAPGRTDALQLKFAALEKACEQELLGEAARLRIIASRMDGNGGANTGKGNAGLSQEMGCFAAMGNELARFLEGVVGPVVAKLRL
jgi:hypothetical protein